MDFHTKELYINRIKSGILIYKYDGKKVYIKRVSSLVEYEACDLYFDMLEEAEEDGIWSDNDALEYMINNGLWSESKQKELDKIVPDHIEYWKVQVYESYLKPDKVKLMKKYLKVAKDELINLLQQRHQFDYSTKEGYAKFAKNLFIITKSIFDESGQPVDIRDINVYNLLSYYSNSMLDEEELREIARTNPWHDDWYSLKKQGKIFKEDDLTYEQRSLILWSTMYDNVKESPDCPSDDILNDDDMLDGWFIVQKRKRDSERRKKEGESLVSKNSRIAGADEVYVVAQSPEEISRINELNTPASLAIKRQRSAQLKQQGVVKEQNFVDSKQTQMMLMNQAYRSQVKGR